MFPNTCQCVCVHDQNWQGWSLEERCRLEVVGWNGSRINEPTLLFIRTFTRSNAKMLKYIHVFSVRNGSCTHQMLSFVVVLNASYVLYKEKVKKSLVEKSCIAFDNAILAFLLVWSCVS